MSLAMSLADRFDRIPRELKLFAIASLTMGMAYSVMDSTFNNFFNDKFALSGFERSFIEFPRELPGFLVVFVSALMWFLCSRRLGALSLALGAVGALLVGFASPSFGILLVWLFIYSVGQHTMMPLSATIGMELARAGKTGQRLGQLNALRNLAAILGSLVVFLGFNYLGFTFHHTFVVIAIALGISAVMLFSMQRQRDPAAENIFKTAQGIPPLLPAVHPLRLAQAVVHHLRPLGAGHHFQAAHPDPGDPAADRWDHRHPFPTPPGLDDRPLR